MALISDNADEFVFMCVRERSRTTVIHINKVSSYALFLLTSYLPW